MQTAYRWYSVKRVGKPVRVSDVAKKIGTAGGESWFQVVDYDAGQFRFFRRNEIWLDHYDLGGQATRQRVEGVSSTEFVVVESGNATLLRVANPGRNMQFLMSALELSLGFGFSSKALAISSWQGSSVLKKADVSKLVSLKVTNVAVLPDCVGRMEFASKEGMTIDGIPLLRSLAFKHDHVKYELIYKGVRGYFSATAGGLVKVGGALSPFILTLIEKDLLRLATGTKS